MIKLLFIAASAALMAAGCIGTPIPPYGIENGTIIHEMLGSFPELRVSAFSQQYIAENARKPLKNTVVFGGWHCEPDTHSPCLAYSIGEEALDHPGLMPRVMMALANPCDTVKVRLEPYPGEPAPRTYGIEQTRKFFGCDGPSHISRTLTLSIIRNYDAIARPGIDREERQRHAIQVIPISTK